MNDLFTSLRISDFRTVLRAYRRAGVDLGDAIDGGAGFGSTSSAMLKELGQEATVYAFEPFPGNHRFFKDLDKRIVLKKCALSDEDGTRKFHVPTTVAPDTYWGRKGLEGYSSVGKIAKTIDENNTYLDVSCVKADSELAGKDIGFIKLDLQGGESAALKGMEILLETVRFMFVELINPVIVPQLHEYGFSTFDTQYVFVGNPSAEAQEVFDVEKRDVRASTGQRRWKGYKKSGWNNYVDEFRQYKKSFSLIQTDLVCVNRRYVSDFANAVPFLAK